MLGLLPQIESRDRKSSPYGGGWRPFGEHPTQSEPALEHTDASFDAAAKPLQLFEPATVLMSSLSSTQPTDLRNANPVDSKPTQLDYIVGTVIAAVGGQLPGHLAQSFLGLADQRNKLGLVARITPLNLVVNDHSRIVLDQLQGTTKLHRLIELALHNGPGLGIKQRHDPLRDTFPCKFVLSLLNQLFGQLNGFTKFLLELGGCRGRQVLQGLTTLGQRVGSQLGYFLENLLPLSFTLFGFGFGTGSPAGQGLLGGPHVTD